MSDGSARPTTYVHDALALFAGYGDREALVGGDRRLSYREVAAEIRALARRLRRHGVRPGAAVLVVAGNVVEAPLLQLALHLLGCRSMWVAPVTSRREIDEFVRLARPDAVVYDARRPDGLGPDLVAALPGVLVCCLGPGPGPDLTVPDDDVPDLTAPADADAAVDPAGIGPAPESFLQTSGSTGTPKLVHHRESFYRQVLAIAGALRDSGAPLLRHLSHSPMWIASGQVTTLVNLFTGGVLFLADDWDPARFVATVDRERINSTFLTPPMLYEVLDHPALDGADFTDMFMFNVGGGPAAPARLRQAIARFGPVLRIVYGLSEAVVVTALPQLTEDPTRPQRLRSCGRPYGDVELEVRDPDGRPLPAGVDGEVWVRTRLSFVGYFGQPELTADTLVDGWVRTRDLGHVDGDGYLYLVDRLADRILTGRRSWPIHSRPIEDVLAGHPQVAAAAVIGAPGDDGAETPYAYVTPVPGATVTGAELVDLVTRELGELWAPQQVEFVDRLPVNRSHKVDKPALRARHTATRQAIGVIR
ncbi:AMP-binding protein [Micromonospora sp. WMMD882]|uniref:AMP-binding protein n=1 Tax=Micromonospora sp. WMMD882 TaxID=3015151 RepID=UPI00248C6D19|nr:AMP-binding protein [Micromonospora sp. WMMD882]WBB80904.1 AMP-binding protein [Micromonospora sp. WMMD882]